MSAPVGWKASAFACGSASTTPGAKVNRKWFLGRKLSRLTPKSVNCSAGMGGTVASSVVTEKLSLMSPRVT